MYHNKGYSVALSRLSELFGMQILAFSMSSPCNAATYHSVKCFCFKSLRATDFCPRHFAIVLVV